MWVCVYMHAVTCAYARLEVNVGYLSGSLPALNFETVSLPALQPINWLDWMAIQLQESSRLFPYPVLGLETSKTAWLFVCFIFFLCVTVLAVLELTL